REDAFCRDGLNTFIQHFGLPEYEPYVRVSYTIHGSYRADYSDPGDAEDDAAANLDVDLSGLSSVIQGSTDSHVEAHEVELLDHYPTPSSHSPGKETLMSENPPVTLQIVFTPQESPAPTPQVLRDWVAREVESLSPVMIDHVTADGLRTY